MGILAPDKQAHFIGGFIIVAVVGFINLNAAMVLCMLAGVLKEAYDWKHPDKHTVEVLDCLMTWAGGAVALVAHLILRAM